MLTTRNRIVTWPIVSSDFWRDMNGIQGEAPPEPEPTWTPRAMISESEDRYTVRLEVPGADMDTLNVELDGDVLLVSWLVSQVVWPDSPTKRSSCARRSWAPSGAGSGSGPRQIGTGSPPNTRTGS